MVFKKLIIFICLFCWFLPVIAAARVVDRIVAKVNGDIINLSDLESLVQSMMELDQQETNEEEMKKILHRDQEKVLNRIIDEKLQLQYAKQRKLMPTKSEIDNAIEEIKKNNNLSDEMLKIMLEREGLSLELYRSKLKEKVALSKVLNVEVSSKVKLNINDITGYYNKNKKEFFKPEEIKARHILLLLDDKSDTIKAANQKKKALHVLKLARTGNDFEDLAKTYSEGPSRDTGGDLGWIKKGDMIPSFEKAAFSVRKGDISDLIRTKYGYHIIKVEGRKKKILKTLDEASDAIEKILYKEKYDKRYDSWMAELRKDSFVEIFLKDKQKKKRRTVKKIQRSGGLSKSKQNTDENDPEKNINKKKTGRTVSTAMKSNNLLKISKFILDWENAFETKNRKRYFSFYAKDFKTNGMNKKKWEKKMEIEYEKYKFINIEVRGLRIFKRNNYYIATFNQRIKSNIDDQIRLVRLYLRKNKNKFEIAMEKWLDSPYTVNEFSRKPLLSYDTLPKAHPKLSKKMKSSQMILPVGFLK